MRLLVTGASGFIGSHLSQLASKHGHTIIGYENDISDIIHYREKVDCICHLAAVHAPEISRSELMRINVVGTQAVIEYARQNRTPIVFTSSSAVYAAGDSASKLTEQSLCEPRNDYGLSKLMAEQLLGYSALPVRILRPFNVYGPNMHKSHLISQIYSAYRAKQPFVLNTPDSVRDFIHVKDVAKALLVAMTDAFSMGIEVYNIGTDIGTKLSDLRLIITKATSYADLQPAAEQVTHSDSYVANSTPFRLKFAWQPNITLLDGLNSL